MGRAPSLPGGDGGAHLGAESVIFGLMRRFPIEWCKSRLCACHLVGGPFGLSMCDVRSWMAGLGVNAEAAAPSILSTCTGACDQ